MSSEFSKSQKGLGGWCARCDNNRKMKQLERNHQGTLLGMRFTNTGPRYAGRDDDKQGGDTIITMKRVREMISYNAGLNDDATWLWLISEQMGFHLSTGGAEEGVRRTEGSDQSESERRDCHPTASHLAPAIYIDGC